MIYIEIIDNKPTRSTSFEQIGKNYQNVITTDYEDYTVNNRKYIFEDGEVKLNPDYEEEQKQKERERIGNLQCTKRVFILMLEHLGFDYYEQILPLIEANRQAKLEWDLCVELERKNPLLDQMAAQLGVSSEQLDNLFRYANNEITEEQFLS